MNSAQVNPDAAAGSGRRGRRKAPIEGETRQVNVKLPARKMLMVDRLVAREGLTLIEYFDRLITEDIRAKQSELRNYFREEEERARREADALEHDLKAALDDERSVAQQSRG